MEDDMPETLDECMKILDDNIEILANLDYSLEDENEDQIVPQMQLWELYDMTEDLSHASKIKRAETNLVRRQNDDLN